MKTTSLFGGVQAFEIIIQIIRSKFVAVLLGPAGMGIAGLLNSTISLITGFTNFGLRTSAVKNIAAAYGTGNETRIANVTIVIRRLMWITGIIGTLATLILSTWLSQLTFGNHDYTIAFIWISITLLFTQLTSGQLVLLQGMRKFKYLAKANLYGNIIGLIFTIPLYYKLGINGIVPGIIIASITSLLLSWFFAQKINIRPMRVSYIRTIAEGKSMLTMGLMISLSGLFANGALYILRIFIRHHGGIEQVGLYNAGFGIISVYTGLIFTALSTDFYPRLSAVARSNKECRQTINQQAEIAVLILAPILIVFLVFINLVIAVLYSNKFIPVNTMISWAALGILFKAASWAVAYQLLAKGESKLFFWNELIANTYLLGFNLLGYYYLGLTGLGLSFMIFYFLYFIQVYSVTKIKFEFFYNYAFIKIFIFQFLLAFFCFLLMKFLRSPFSYIFGLLIIIISTLNSYTELDKRLGLKNLLIRYKGKSKIT